MLRLEPVTKRTFKQVIDMKLSAEQNLFVAPNVVSLAQAWLYYKEAKPYAVCNNDEVVGFLMFDWDEEERTAGIWRFMIATKHQKKGYGKRAMQLAIQMVKEAGCFDLIGLDYVESNQTAQKLYYSLGFRETGEIEDGEIIMALPLTDTPTVCALYADDEDIEEINKLIEAEQNNGTNIAKEFSDIEKAIETGKLIRFVIMGETAGIFYDGALLLGKAYSEFLPKVKEKIIEMTSN